VRCGQLQNRCGYGLSFPKQSTVPESYLLRATPRVAAGQSVYHTRAKKRYPVSPDLPSDLRGTAAANWLLRGGAFNASLRSTQAGLFKKRALVPGHAAVRSAARSRDSTRTPRAPGQLSVLVSYMRMPSTGSKGAGPSIPA